MGELRQSTAVMTCKDMRSNSRGPPELGSDLLLCEVYGTNGNVSGEGCFNPPFPQERSFRKAVKKKERIRTTTTVMDALYVVSHLLSLHLGDIYH